MQTVVEWLSPGSGRHQIDAPVDGLARALKDASEGHTAAQLDPDYKPILPRAL